MKKINFLLAVIAFLFTNTLFGQGLREGEEVRDTTISVLAELNGDREVILFSNEQYTITSSLDDVTQYLEKFAKDFAIEKDQELLDVIKESAASEGKINLQKLIKEKDLLKRLKFLTADMLEKSQCLIFDSKNSKNIENIMLQSFYYSCGQGCGEGGRRFKIDDNTLIEVVDFNKE